MNGKLVWIDITAESQRPAVVCRTCHGSGGLVLDRDTDEFVHRDPLVCEILLNRMRHRGSR